jgi:hypothetical protein
MRCAAIFLVVLVAVAQVGCSKKPAADASATNATTPSDTASSQATAAAPAPQPIAVPASALPEQVVTVFLNALRNGDSPTTELLLTSKAREELAKHQLSVDVVSAPNSTYEVRSAEGVSGDPTGAHVTSVWTEKFDDGEEKYEIVWALRRQPEGWRLAGMAMQLIPDQPMQFLNFENPEDMLKKKDDAIAAMQAPAAETAQQPPPAASQPAAIER